MGVQRQRERPENQEMVRRSGRQAGRGFEPPRQMAVYDVSATETAAQTVVRRTERYLFQLTITNSPI